MAAPERANARGEQAATPDTLLKDKRADLVCLLRRPSYQRHRDCLCLPWVAAGSAMLRNAAAMTVVAWIAYASLRWR